MVDKISGKIEAVSVKKNGYGIKIGSIWLNAFGKCNFNKGDEVEVEYETNDKGFNNIKTIKKIEETLKAEEKTEEQYFKRATEVEEPENLDKTMIDTIVKIQNVYSSDTILDKEFKDKIDWTKVIISLFIAKIKRGI